MNGNTKEWIQYGTAVAMVASGIVLALLSFFLNSHDIADGVLWYISEALIYAGGIFGVNIYFRTRLGEFEHRTRDELKELFREARPRGTEKEERSDDGICGGNAQGACGDMEQDGGEGWPLRA